MSAFTAYFDASGSEHDQPCLAVAGFLATAEQWIDFEDAWLGRLRQDGFEYFQSRKIRRDLESDRPRLDRLYIDLIEIIKGHVDRTFGCAFVNSALSIATEQERKDWHMNSYSLAGRACAGQVRLWFESWHARQLPELIFEHGDYGFGELANILVRDGFPYPTFKPKIDFVQKNGMVERAVVPLQAADLFAFELFDPTRKIINDGRLHKIRPSLKAFDRIPGEPVILRLGGMQQLVELAKLNNDEIWIGSD